LPLPQGLSAVRKVISRLLQDIRNRHHDLPIILCTAYDTYKYDPKAIAADYYVVKSFDLSELIMAIERATEANTSVNLTGT
jgi:two-component SAPR family response regulator